MAKLRGLILAATSSADDDLAHRLQGRSRYAMPLANRVLVRYAAEALVNCGVRGVAVAVSPSTSRDVRELLGDGRQFGAHFQYLDVPESATVAETFRPAYEQMGDHPLIIHGGDALAGDGLRGVVEEFHRIQPDALVVTEPSHAYPETVLVGERGRAPPDPEPPRPCHQAP